VRAKTGYNCLRTGWRWALANKINNIQQYIITVHKITDQPTITDKFMSYMSSLKSPSSRPHKFRTMEL